jgi:hypothetical protein
MVVVGLGTKVLAEFKLEIVAKDKYGNDNSFILK